MSGKREFSVPDLIRVPEASQEDLAGVKTYSLSDTFVATVADIVYVSNIESMLQEANGGVPVGENGMPLLHPIDAIKSILLYADPADPTGTRVTPHPIWLEHHRAGMQAIMDRMGEIGVEMVHAQAKPSEETDEG